MDYRGEVQIICTNIGEVDFLINEHERIAQGKVTPVIQAIFEEVEELSSTVRGEGGFGSTDKPEK